MFRVATFYCWVNRLLLHFLLAGSCCLAGQQLQGQAVPYRLFSVSENREIDLSQLVDAVEEDDVLFFGERHDDSIAHVLQDSLYGLLIARYQKVGLSLEMFENDCQLVVDEYLANRITEQQLEKDGRAWSSYLDHYHPLVERARITEQAVIAANAPRRYVNLVSRLGLSYLDSLSKSAKTYLPPLPIETDYPDYLQRFEEAMGGSGHVNINYFHAQCTWDAAMAYHIYRHWRRNRNQLIFHLNGSFHTDHYQGTVKQLLALRPKLKIKTISCIPLDDISQVDWANYTDRADFILLTQAPEIGLP